MYFLRRTLYLWVAMGLGLGVMSPSWGQSYLGPADRSNTPRRLNDIRPQPLAPHNQQPPHEWSAAYMRNAFGLPGQNPPVFVLDSSICGPGVDNTSRFLDLVKAVYDYDPVGRIREIRYQQRPPGGTFENFSKKQFVYRNGEQEQYLYQLWDDNSQAWEDDFEVLSQFNNQDQRTETVYRERNAMGQWRPIRRQEVGYNAKGYPSEIVTSIWSNGNWEPGSRENWFYNNRGYFRQILLQDWNGSSWDTLIRETATYDSLDAQWNEYLLERKDLSSGVFSPELKEQYIYNRRGFWTGMIREEIDTTSLQLVQTAREIFQYTSRGVWTSWSQQVWENGAWKPNFQQEFVMGPRQGGRQEQFRRWNEGNGTWENSRRFFTEFDLAGNLIREGGAQVWDTLASDWQNTSSTEYCQHFWSQAPVTGLKPTLPPSLCMIPNPYRIHSPVHCEAMEAGMRYRVTLSDNQGRIVLKTHITGGSTFSLDQELPHGMYQCNIYEKNELLHSQKIIYSTW